MHPPQETAPALAVPGQCSKSRLCDEPRPSRISFDSLGLHAEVIQYIPQ